MNWGHSRGSPENRGNSKSGMDFTKAVPSLTVRWLPESSLTHDTLRRSSVSRTSRSIGGLYLFTVDDLIGGDKRASGITWLSTFSGFFGETSWYSVPSSESSKSRRQFLRSSGSSSLPKS